MNREDITQKAINESKTNKCLILELPTGYGKTKAALDIIKDYNRPMSILLIVAQVIHKQNWQVEIDKWGDLKDCTITCDCYQSLKKHMNESYDIVILDEGHHLSDERKMMLSTITINTNLIVLSATLKPEMKGWFISNYKTKVIKETLQSAIQNDVLPNPDIRLYPLVLKDDGVTELYVRNPKKPITVRVTYDNLKNNLYRKDVRIECYMTKTQYLKQISSDIEYWKQATMRGLVWAKNQWLSLAGTRLKWLAEKKEKFIQNLLNKYKDKRTLTFCASVEQTEVLGSNSINSKKKDCQSIIDSFNNHTINHITACDMLNEGISLMDCQYGILVKLNSSDRIVTQRIGRILRHPKPVIVIPYFINTREEEIVNKLLEGYDPDKISIKRTIYEY